MKTKNYLLITLLTIATFNTNLYSQENSIVPVTPEAAALAKMVNYPINLNTGVPDIKIPFYEINVGGITLPVTLSYHAGGFKINEQATRSGLGWSLTSDIQITRTINGVDDFRSSWGYLANQYMKRYSSSSATYPFWSTSPFPYANSYDLATKVRDGLPDKFNYKLLNKSGSFYFLKNSSGSGYTILPVPFDNLKIQHSNGQFIITDTDGTKYYFGQPGTGGDYISRALETSRNSSSSADTRTAWKCIRIVAPNGTDEISFTYVPKTITTYRSYNDRIEYYNNDSPCGLDLYYTSDQAPMNTTTNYDYLPPKYKISSPKYLEVSADNGISKYHVPYVDAQGNVIDKVYDKNDITNYNSTQVKGLSVSEISFRGGKVKFNGADKLTSIQVLDVKNQEVKSMQLFHSYKQAVYANESKTYNGSNFQGTMYLDSVHIKNLNETFDRYALVYNDKFCYGNHLKGHDAWGYPNQSTIEIPYANQQGTNALSLPSIDIVVPRYYFSLYGGCTDYITNVPITIGGNDDWAETPDESIMLRGVIKRIVYPTGGYVDFDFEANKYQAIFNNGAWEEKLPQVSGGLRIRSINYYKPGQILPETQKYYRYGDLEDGTGLMLNQPTFSEGVYRFDAVSHEQRIVYLENPNSGDCSQRGCLSVITTETKTTYEPASALDYTYSNGSPIYYTKVSEYQHDLGKQTGKIVYEYYPPDHFYDYQTPYISDNRIPGTNLTYLKADGLMGAQRSITKYTMQHNQKYKPVHKIEYEYERYLNPNQIHVAYAYLRVIYNVVEGSFSGDNRYLYDNSKSFMGAGFSEDEYIVGEYGIPSVKLLLEKETETWFDDTGNHSVSNVYSYNNLPFLQASMVTTTNSKNESITKNIKFPYDFIATPIYAEMVNRNMIDRVVETVEKNSTEGEELSRTKTIFKEWPIGFSLIAPEEIQRSFQGAPLKTQKTFDQYDQYGNILQTTEKEMHVTSYLWGYNKLYPVAELRGVSYASIPATYKSNTQINDPSSDGSLRTLLNALRDEFYGHQQVSTYTYKRLVGLTSSTLPNNQISYYDYDGIGRLISVRDHDQKLIQVYDYAMRGPTPSAIDPNHYVNFPIMRTHNVSMPNGGMIAYNHIFPGGEYLGFDMQDATSYAEDQAEILPTQLDDIGPGTTQLVKIDLTGEFYGIINPPTWIDIDFIQEGSIVATKRLIPRSGIEPLPIVTLFLPEGEYQVSMRLDPSHRYTGDIVGYALHVRVPPNHFDYRIHTGQTILFESNQEYNIDALDFPFD